MIDVAALINLTNDFYNKIGLEFDKTRQTPWKGWDIIIDKILADDGATRGFSVLDIGCGNGRFLDYLETRSNFKLKSYLGVDSNEFLLTKTKGEFLKGDFISDVDSIPGKFDIVCAFGLTHHVPSTELRMKWFKEVSEKVNDNGYFVFSNWRIDLLDDFKAKVLKSDLDLEENDYILGWNDSDAKRYVHIYKEAEMKDIADLLSQKGFEKFCAFFADGRNDKLNEYYVFKKS
jgi:SAM-dependent methyltransferase